MIIISFLVVGTRAVKISSSGDALSMSLFFLLRVVFFAQSDVDGIFSCEKKKISFSAYEKRAVHTLEKIEGTSHGAPLSANEKVGRKERERINK
jgi:hypothetical protein